MEIFSFELVPWAALPPPFQDRERFPPNIGLGQRVRAIFATPFLTSALEPGKARDLLLRGRYSKAVPELVRERDHWHDQQKRRANAVEVERRANEWSEQAFRTYLTQIRAKTPGEREAAEQEVTALWQPRRAEPIYVLLNSAMAAARAPQVTYLLGLCMQEQAEQLQARVDLQTRMPDGKPHPSDVERAKQAWQDARNTWKQYIEDYPNRGDCAAARRMRGRAEAMLGDKKAAIASWKDLSGTMTPLEKLASLYEARQLEKMMIDE